MSAPQASVRARLSSYVVVILALLMVGGLYTAFTAPMTPSIRVMSTCANGLSPASSASPEVWRGVMGCPCRQRMAGHACSGGRNEVEAVAPINGCLPDLVAGKERPSGRAGWFCHSTMTSTI